jgi:hypothetical protein
MPIRHGGYALKNSSTRFFAMPRSFGASKSWRNGIGTDMANPPSFATSNQRQADSGTPTSQNFRDLVLRVLAERLMRSSIPPNVARFSTTYRIQFTTGTSVN